MAYNNNQNQTQAPVNVDEVYTGAIESVGEKGDGILRVKGFVVFVPGVEKGDFVKVRIKKVLAKVSFGELVEKVEPPKGPVPRSAPPKKQTKEEEELKELLTTEGDSEDFGEELESDDDDDDL